MFAIIAISVKAFFLIRYAFDARNRPMEQKTKGKNTGKPCNFSKVTILSRKLRIDISETRNETYEIVINDFCII
ncbi:hypothetical protein [Lentibacillus kapialis]|nr:hypothetical protein [Lentibacillus kapialis]